MLSTSAWHHAAVHPSSLCSSRRPNSSQILKRSALLGELKVALLEGLGDDPGANQLLREHRVVALGDLDRLAPLGCDGGTALGDDGQLLSAWQGRGGRERLRESKQKKLADGNVGYRAQEDGDAICREG